MIFFDEIDHAINESKNLGLYSTDGTTFIEFIRQLEGVSETQIHSSLKKLGLIREVYNVCPSNDGLVYEFGITSTEKSFGWFQSYSVLSDKSTLDVDFTMYHTVKYDLYMTQFGKQELYNLYKKGELPMVGFWEEWFAPLVELEVNCKTNRA